MTDPDRVVVLDDDVVPSRWPLPDQGDGILLGGAMEALRDFLGILSQLDLRQLDLLKKQSRLAYNGGGRA